MKNSNGFARTILLAIAAIFLTTSAGCTTMTAAIVPPPVDDESISIGMDRAQVERLIVGVSNPISFQGGSIVHYRYEDQSNPIWRAPFYFIFGAADLALFPIEMAVQRSGQRWATGVYDVGGHLVRFISENAAGRRVIELGGSAKNMKPRPRRHSLLRVILGPQSHQKENDDDDDE